MSSALLAANGPFAPGQLLAYEAAPGNSTSRAELSTLS
jgi:hypothetical protein